MTLIEAVIWISMFTVAMSAIVTSVIYFYRSSNFAIQEASAISAAQHGMDLMVRTIREASYASDGAYPVAAIATSSFTFYADVDSDSAIERVHYYLNNKSLIKGVADPTGDPPTYPVAEATTSISESMRNFDENVALFTYYNKTGGLITDYTKRGDVRFVTLNVIVDIDPNRTPTTTSLRSSAALRNLSGQ